MDKGATFENVHEATLNLSDVRWSFWSQHTVLSWPWWFLLISTALCLVLWVKLVDCRRLLEICLYGSLVISVVMLLDMIGGELQLWDYPAMVLPWGPRIISVDIIMTLIYMLIYQYFGRWGSYIAAITLMSLVFSFIFEPIAVWMNVYRPIAWKNYYSVPGYLIIGILLKSVLQIIVRQEQRVQNIR